MCLLWDQNKKQMKEVNCLFRKGLDFTRYTSLYQATSWHLNILGILKRLSVFTIWNDIYLKNFFKNDIWFLLLSHWEQHGSLLMCLTFPPKKLASSCLNSCSSPAQWNHWTAKSWNVSREDSYPHWRRGQIPQHPFLSAEQHHAASSEVMRSQIFWTELPIFFPPSSPENILGTLACL